MEEVLHQVTKLDEFLMHKMRTTEKRFDKHFIPIKRKKRALRNAAWHGCVGAEVTGCLKFYSNYVDNRVI